MKVVALGLALILSGCAAQPTQTLEFNIVVQDKEVKVQPDVTVNLTYRLVR